MLLSRLFDRIFVEWIALKSRLDNSNYIGMAELPERVLCSVAVKFGLFSLLVCVGLEWQKPGRFSIIFKTPITELTFVNDYRSFNNFINSTVGSMRVSS